MPRKRSPAQKTTFQSFPEITISYSEGTDIKFQAETPVIMKASDLAVIMTSTTAPELQAKQQHSSTDDPIAFLCLQLFSDSSSTNCNESY
jgi:hypothetical protein